MNVAKPSKRARFLSLPIADTKITDEQWAEIAACGELREEARPLIERAIAQYMLFDQAFGAIGSPAVTRKFLADLAKKTEGFRADIKKAAKSPLAILVLALAIPDGRGAPTRQTEVKGHLKEANAGLRRLSRWLEAASSRIAAGRSGAHGSALKNALFVKILDEILFELTGTGISRSNKGRHTPRDFIQAAFRIAGPGVSNAAIEEAMKRVIKGRGEIARRKGR